jgi:hypothetical protein
MTSAIQIVIAELLTMNKDALAALVRLGGDAPLKFVTDPTYLFTVRQMLRQAEGEPRTGAGSLD